MPSYTVQVMLVNPTHDSNSVTYCVGDVVAVYNLVTEKPNPDGRLGFVHVHNVPEKVDFLTLSQELSRPEMIAATNQPEILKRRAWAVNMESFEGLVDEKEVNINWSDAVNVFYRKSDGKTGGEYYAELSR